MYIRCGVCGDTTRVPFGQMTNGSVTCGSCGKPNSTARAGELGATPNERYERAESFSKQHKIDLASAYSVLLGLMPLHKALSTIARGPVAPPPTPPAPPGAADAPRQTYDVAFRDAVVGGFLTVRQAVERGDRVLYASKLAERHGLSMYLAFQVADNRLELAEALRRMSDKSEAMEPGGSADHAPASRRAIVPAAIVVLAVVAGVIVYSASAGGHRTGVAIPGAANAPQAGGRLVPTGPQRASEVRLDAAGRPVAVVAPDPESVLSAYCGSTTGPVFRTPEKVVHSGNEYVGYYFEGGIRYALRIRVEPGGFAAGSVTEPIRPEAAPHERTNS